VTRDAQFALASGYSHVRRQCSLAKRLFYRHAQCHNRRRPARQLTTERNAKTTPQLVENPWTLFTGRVVGVTRASDRMCWLDCVVAYTGRVLRGEKPIDFL
jgi:hypothetical protein